MSLYWGSESYSGWIRIILIGTETLKELWQFGAQSLGFKLYMPDRSKTRGSKKPSFTYCTSTGRTFKTVVF
jgi:hypothetical protein